MRCLYCGEPLSLLRKLTGKAEFCSDAHREAYQDEFNSLALERLAAQPSQKRREPAKFMSRVDLAPRPEPISSPEPFAGLPFPEDPDDLESPTFEPEVLVASVHAAAPAVAGVAEPEPPPLWGWLSAASPSAAGQNPPSYSFPLWLADYPRGCQMTNGVDWHATLVSVPSGGYVDLPTVMDDQQGAKFRVEVEPLGASRILPFWDAPLEVWPLVSKLSAETRMTRLPVTETRHRDSAGALCTLGWPGFERPATRSAIASPPTVLAEQPNLAHGEWPSLARLTLDANFGAHSSNSAAEALPPAPDWSGPAAAMEFPIPSTYSSAGGLQHATVAPAQPLESVPGGEPTVLGSAIPECETFDAERSLIAPNFHICVEASVPSGVLLALDLETMRVEQSGSTGSGLGRKAMSGSALPFAPSAARWSPAGVAAPALAPMPEAALVGLHFELIPATAPGDGAPVEPPNCRPLLIAPVTAAAPGRPTPLSDDSATLHPVERLLSLVDHLPVMSSMAGEYPEVSVDPVPEAHWEPLPWRPEKPLGAALPIPAGQPLMSKLRVKDFRWPDFAAGCESLFTPDQPFRFHEVPFPSRGITDTSVGDVLRSELFEGLRLDYVDDRFDGILHPGFDQAQADLWLDEATSGSAAWPRARRPEAAPPQAPVAYPAVPPAVSAPPSATARPSGPASTGPVSTGPGTEPPSPWQQAARAMHEGEQQQISREPQAARPLKSADPAKSTGPGTADPGQKPAPPVVAEPLNGMELTHPARPEPPVPFVKTEPPGTNRQDRSPANEGQQFEWRREQPHQAPPPPPPQGTGSSTVSVNTTVTVEGNGNGVVVENAVRISLGNNGNTKNKKGSGLEKFTDGEDIADSGIEIVAPEGLPGFVAGDPELRAMLEPIPPVPDSIQWPKFSVMPMRRRIAFGPPNRNLFGGSHGATNPKTPPAEAKPLPPKKTVGFLFRKLTNS